jgi:signal transduction histidine kinase
MRLKTKLVLAITALVLVIAGLLSLVYVTQFLYASVSASYDTNKMVANQVRLAVQNALETGLEGRTFDPNKPYELREMAADTIRKSDALKVVIDSVNRYSDTVYDVNIDDSSGRVILSTLPENQEKTIPPRPDFSQLPHANPITLIKAVLFEKFQVYDLTVTLERNNQPPPFVYIHVGVSTTFLRTSYAPWLKDAFDLMSVALGIALVVALLLSNLALRPLEEISMQLDYWTAASESAEEDKARARQDTAARVSTKIEQIGQRMRNVEEVFSALKDNLDQILGNLQDGILLFTGDGRAVLVSEAARRFLQVERGKVLGLHASKIFDRSTVLGQVLGEAFDSGTPLVKEEIRTETGRRIQASVDFIQDDFSHQGLGALVTLRDLESMEEIESELELSRRMAAIGRLTSGVAHEVKNPINAIVVHLELLKNKLNDPSAPAVRHLEVIDMEIRRLDRVVQTLVDFSRPVELQLQEQDLRLVIGDVLALATEELSTRSVILENHLPAKAVMANVDADLLKQATLNVIENGAQAMPEGGRLEVTLETDRKFAVLRIADEGVGIPDEIREKIFDLYFTTKSGGSGIGLAMTYRILQLHHGAVEVQSREIRGTEFRLRIPLAATEWGRRHLQPAGVEETKGIGE